MSEVRVRRPGLDGLRAVAVAAVVAYHLDPHAVPGGYLGVSTFFTLSGFLITSLLLEEVAGTARVDLRGFWTRRCRRLWPVAWIMLAAVAVADAAGIWGVERSARLPGEEAAALLNVANWWQLAHDGYLAALGEPSPLRHMWSLAIEEQFYLVWPILVALVARRWIRGVPLLVAATVAGSLLATLAAGDPERVYLGTDTRAAELAVGAALAWAWRAHPRQGPAVGRRRHLIGAVGGLAAGLLVAAVLRVPSDATWWSHGGLVVVAGLSTAVVAAAITPGPLARLLSVAPMVWIGERSYAIYLVHWPILVAQPPAWPLAVRASTTVAATLAIAAASRRWVERPVLAGGIEARRLVTAGVLVAVVAVALPRWVAPDPAETIEAEVGRSLATLPDPTPLPPPSSSDPPGSVPVVRAPTSAVVPAPSSPASSAPPPSTSAVAPPCPPPTGPVAPPTAGPAGEAFDPATVEAVPDPLRPDPACGAPLRVLVVGDSTGRGVANGLRRTAPPEIEVWDRTVLGCSMGDVADCPDWEEWWGASVRDVEPDVVVAYLGMVTDIRGVPDEPFDLPGSHTERVVALGRAMDLLAQLGAEVVWTLPPVPRPPRGLFYCDGRVRRSQCDGEWVATWAAAVREASATRGVRLADVGAWVGARGAADVEDRPDGLHFTGAALDAHARWLLPQLRPGGGLASGGPAR